MTGSIYYVTHPNFPLANHVAMINLETLGRAADKPFSINGSASSPAWVAVVKAVQDQTQTKVAVNIPFVVPDSDYYPFGASKIPSAMLYVSSAADEAHRPSDTADKIDFARTAEAARFAGGMLLAIADLARRPDYATSPIPEPGLVAHQITPAEADMSKLAAEASGLKVTGVIAGRAGAVAGLREGDLIIEMVGKKFLRSDTLEMLQATQMQMLQGKFGFTIPLVVLRDGQRVSLTINIRPDKP
jgi:aminopeptidase YwaD